MSNNVTIFSPYGELPEADVHTTTIGVSRRDWAFLQGVYGGRGATQAVLYNLMSRFVQELKNHGITDYDPDNLKHCIEHARITIPGPIAATAGPVDNGIPRSPESEHRPEAVSGNDGRGVASVEQPCKGRVNKLSNNDLNDTGETSKGRKVRPKRTTSKH